MVSNYRIEFTETALDYLVAYKKFESNIILKAIKMQLPHQPMRETRNRKFLRDNPLSD